MTDAHAARLLLNASVSEKEFLAMARHAASLNGWLAYHTHRSDRSAPGFPDIIAIRNDRLLALELKVRKNRPTPEQMIWLESFARVRETRAAVLYPSDWEMLEALLQ